MEASDWQVKLIMQMRESLYQMVASDWLVIKGVWPIMQMKESRDQIVSSDWLVIKGAWPIMQMRGHVTKWWPLIGCMSIE